MATFHYEDLSVKDMFINIRHNCAFQENSKNVFVNKVYVPEFYTLKFLIKKETMVAQIAAVSVSPTFYSGKSYVKN